MLDEVAARRKIELPREFFIRLDNPHLNPFLRIPLERGDFPSADDPDFQRILECFKDVPAALDHRIDVDFRKVIGAE